MSNELSRSAIAALLVSALILTSPLTRANSEEPPAMSPAAELYDKAIPVTQKKSSPPIADSAYWFFAGVGGAHVSTYNAFAFNTGLYGSNHRFVYGLRFSGNKPLCSGAFSDDNCHVRYGTEQALMLGGYLDSRNKVWIATGIARVDSFGGRHPDQRYVDVGLPMELVFSPGGSTVAPEFRFNVDLNKMNSFMMLTVGVRWGQLR